MGSSGRKVRAEVSSSCKMKSQATVAEIKKKNEGKYVVYTGRSQLRKKKIIILLGHTG